MVGGASPASVYVMPSVSSKIVWRGNGRIVNMTFSEDET